MKHFNYEFKARLKNEKHIRAVLKKVRAYFVGTDQQVDTYFRVPVGRLKVREGRIENALIFYERRNAPGARRARIELAPQPRRNPAKAVLAAALGVLTVVDKLREIYFVGNAKIHLDRVRGLGKFVEVEAIKKLRVDSGQLTVRDKRICKQAQKFQKLFGIDDAEIIPESHSDLILQKMSY